MRRLLIGLVVAGLAAVLGLAATLQASGARSTDSAPFPDQRDSVQQAAYWLVREHQNVDGGFASFSAGADTSPSTVGGTLDAMLALSAAGYGMTEPFPGKSAAPLDFLADNPAAVVEYAAFEGNQVGGSQAGKLVLALTAANQDPRSFVDHNFVISVTERLEPSGAFGVADAFKQSLAMLALAAVREPVPTSAVNWLIDQQAEDGSWDDGFGTLANPDATAMAIMALLAAGESPADDPISDAVAFLAQAQLPDGSWEYSVGFGGNASSTALVAQALSALGEDWYSGAGGWSANGVAPLALLLAGQSESGAFQADFGQGPFDDFFTSVQVLPAVAGQSYPLTARHEAVLAGLLCLEAIQDASGGWEQFAGAGKDAGGTSRAVQAIAAAGSDPQAARWTPTGGSNAVEALEAASGAYVDGGRGGRTGIVMQGVAAAGPPYDATQFGGENLVLVMSGYLSPTGAYDSTAFGIFAHAEAMLGLLAVDAPVAPKAMDVLLDAATNGDWGETDQNGIALQVLGGLNLSHSQATLSALRATQLSDGAWGFGSSPSPSTSSEVVQGLAAVGQNPFGPQWRVAAGGRLDSAAEAVIALQQESGCWENGFTTGPDPFGTTDAIILLSLEPGWGFSQVNLPVVQAGR